MWFSGNYLELEMTKDQAEFASHSGQCEAEVLSLSQVPAIAAQLAKLDPEKVRLELHEYGAWSDAELADHGQNLQRLLWLAAGDIAEGRGEESPIDPEAVAEAHGVYDDAGNGGA